MKVRIVAPALIAAAAVAALAAPAIARADAVTTWNAYATNVLTGPAPSQAPNVAALHLAMVHGAIYDAVVSIAGKYQPYLGKLEADPTASKVARRSTWTFVCRAILITAWAPRL